MSKKIEAFWENATADDVARVMAGETVEARFREFEADDWYYSELVGWFSNNGTNWMSSGFVSWRFCQVYREPSWWTDKPDPGPGWRLLGKFPDEDLQLGDEVWFTSLSCWEASESAILGEPQAMSMWYRRRIEPVEPKFSVGQTVKVVGPKQIPALEWSSVGMAQYAGTTQTIDRVELLTNPPGTYYHLKGVVNWCFREDYLEAVEPEPVEAPNTYHYTNPGDVVHCPNGTVIVIGSKGFEVTQ
jgi:hypothetical protein